MKKILYLCSLTILSSLYLPFEYTVKNYFGQTHITSFLLIALLLFTIGALLGYISSQKFGRTECLCVAVINFAVSLILWNGIFLGSISIFNLLLCGYLILRAFEKNKKSLLFARK